MGKWPRMGLPRWSSGWDSELSMGGAAVPTPGEETRSHMPQGPKTNIKQYLNKFNTFKKVHIKKSFFFFKKVHKGEIEVGAEKREWRN